MSFFSSTVRYGSFALAIAGIYEANNIVQSIRAQDNQKIPPPAVAPPAKPYADTVAASGILEALSENVSIGVPEPGLVTEVFVKVSDHVKLGQSLFKLDDRSIAAQLLAQRAMIDVERANISSLQATATSAQATVAVQKANWVKATDMVNRMQGVTDKRAISQDELKNKMNDVEVSKEMVAASLAQVLAAEAAVKAGEAKLKSAEATLKQSEMLLERLTVRAPRDGSIIQLNIRAGEYAATAPKNPAIVLGDLEKLQVRADVDEQSAFRIREGMPAKCFLKGDAENSIPLTFVRIEPFVIPKVSLTGAATERVDTRVLQVIYSLKRPPAPPLYVGQQVDVYIDVKK